jgi:hypothetical protein
VLRRVVNLENDDDLGIEGGLITRRKVWLHVEDHSADPFINCLGKEKERFYSTVIVGPCMTEFGPAFISVLSFQGYRDTTRWRAARNVKDVS